MIKTEKMLEVEQIVDSDIYTWIQECHLLQKKTFKELAESLRPYIEINEVTIYYWAKKMGVVNSKIDREKWVLENQGKHFCQCGCNGEIRIIPKHHSVGIPKYLHYHGVKRENNHFWNNGRTVDKSGYILVNVIDHPFARNGYVREHRLVVENYLKTYCPNSSCLIHIKGYESKWLNPELIVHHIDFNKQNNDIANLALMTLSTHNSLHNKFKSIKGEKDNNG